MFYKHKKSINQKKSSKYFKCNSIILGYGETNKKQLKRSERVGVEKVTKETRKPEKLKL